MNLLRRFRGHAYILVLLSILGFTYAEHDPTLLFFSLLAIAVSWWIIERPGGRVLPRWLINVGVLLASVALFYELVLMPPESLLLALGHFMVLILLCKLFETKSNRDYAQILTLSLLIIVTGAIFSSTLIFATILAVYLVLGLYAVLLFHLRAETERAARESHLPPVPSDKLLRRDIRTVATGSGAVLFVIAALVFLVLPRDRGRELLGGWNFNRSVVSGLADRVILGDISRLQQSDAIAMEVRIEQNGTNIGSEADQYYFRAMTLDVYDAVNQQWMRAEPNGFSERQVIEREGTLPIVDPGDNSAWLITQTYTLINPVGNNLFAVAEPVTARSTQISALRYYPRDCVLSFPGTAVSGMQYQVDSFYRWPPGYALPQARLAFYGIVGNFDQRVRQPLPPVIAEKAREWAGPVLAEGIPHTAPAIREIADNFVHELRTRYAYSLQTHAVDRTLDPTADFLANRQTIGGHCEYFASAMVMLCTQVQIPARLVAGYHGGEFNAVGGFYTVRQRNAHAWVEVYIPDEGWVTFDPTPPSGDVEAAGSFGWVRWVREFLQTIEHEWVSSIVTFDNNTRRYLAEQILDPLFGFFVGSFDSLKFGLRGFIELFHTVRFSMVTRVFVVLDILTVLAGTAWLARNIRRRRQSAVRAMLRRVDHVARQRLVQELGFFDDFLRILRRSGRVRLPHQTPVEYAAAACASDPAADTDARWVIGQFYDIRFGGASVTTELRAQIDSALARLRRQLTHRA